MNLSNVVHENYHHLQRHPQYSHKPRYPVTQNKIQQPYHQDMATALISNPYTNQISNNRSYSASSNTPPSPPVEDPNSKCTLPSIQSLIGMANDSMAENAAQPSDASPQQEQHNRAVPTSTVEQAQDRRPSTLNQQGNTDPKMMPPTPPLRPDSGFEGVHPSPSVTSSHSSFTSIAMNNTEVLHQRHQPHHSTEPYMAIHPGQSPYTNSPYTSSPSTMSSYSYPSPAYPPPPVTSGGMYYQRPLPATYPPPDLPMTNVPPPSSSANVSPIDHNNPWQHHHYISPATSAAFAGQTQDRYVCQTCNKAFSRPSSLRIHSHSHTGEKPFKCQHAGCGKAFSVRSNMKRHERGCHGGGSPGSS